MRPDVPVHGTGLGLRFEYIEQFAEAVPPGVDFVEITAEHYFRRGGLVLRQLEAVLQQVPAICHGLNSNLGGSHPLNEDYLSDIRRFLDRYEINLFSDHLCHSSDEEWMHNLMPIPFTEEAVRHTARRIRRVQEFLERPVAIENISYLAAPGQQMSEVEFYVAVLEEADCLAMLDVNNLYLNSQNFGYDAESLVEAIPNGRIAYAHMAGHEVVARARNGEEDLLLYVDSHGHSIADPVLDLLDAAYARHGVFPACVERDQNIPPVSELLAELDAIREIQCRRQPQAAVASR